MDFNAIEVIGLVTLFFFTYTVVTQLWARMSSHEAAAIIFFPAFCLWVVEIPILIMTTWLILRFGSAIAMYLWVFYLGFYFALFMIDCYTGRWRFHTPASYGREINRIHKQIRELKQKKIKKGGH